MKIKLRINKLKKSFIRDRWGNLLPCHWNRLVKEDVLKLEKQIK